MCSIIPWVILTFCSICLLFDLGLSVTSLVMGSYYLVNCSDNQMVSLFCLINSLTHLIQTISLSFLKCMPTKPRGVLYLASFIILSFPLCWSIFGLYVSHAALQNPVSCAGPVITLALIVSIHKICVNGFMWFVICILICLTCLVCLDEESNKIDLETSKFERCKHERI
ncbi:uncharacterized protein LOC111711968 [Eurytemora carolleeae]|uniref:uncharacterized protein LOC111711968 n=1 Tax=Eurytemora carolleeae TaxID=1294199 RepID=UPI000C76745A|nr:uncharacterized protein LOC111711968 [Eurytemora carolleeae]|eukprot:XP_023342229.1 uncharacterized protein LOC111711968 [Eurytemora affinis]